MIWNGMPLTQSTKNVGHLFLFLTWSFISSVPADYFLLQTPCPVFLAYMILNVPPAFLVFLLLYFSSFSAGSLSSDLYMVEAQDSAPYPSRFQIYPLGPTCSNASPCVNTFQTTTHTRTLTCLRDHAPLGCPVVSQKNRRKQNFYFSLSFCILVNNPTNYLAAQT